MMYGVPNVEVVSWPPGLCEARVCIPSAEPATTGLGGHQCVLHGRGQPAPCIRACITPGDLNFVPCAEIRNACSHAPYLVST